MANHLTFEERGFLYRLKKKGKSSTEIAELMGRHRSTICREWAATLASEDTDPSRLNVWRTNGVWRVGGRTEWMIRTCINTCSKNWSSIGRPIRSLDG